MGTVKTGDRVRVTIEGTIGAYLGLAGDCTHELQGDSGVHRVFLGGSSIRAYDDMVRDGLTVEKLEPEYVTGQAYIDAYNDILIRRDGGWMTSWGGEKSDSWASKPLRKLVPESA